MNNYEHFSDSDYTAIRVAEQRVARMESHPENYGPNQLAESKQWLAETKAILSKKYKMIIY